MDDADEPGRAENGPGEDPSGDDERPAGRSQRPLTRSVLKHANQVHGLLKAAGRPDLAGAIGAEAARWGDTEVRIVVAGEIKRGKSSLVNALLGRPGLLPVDADVATSVHLLVHHAVPDQVEVTRLGEGGAVESFEISPAELIDYASMRGDPTRRHGVTDVRVGVDLPLLERGLVLVDTPGVGGMTRGHRDLTMAALAKADALVFTISAQEPIARTELEFLAEAGERIEHVLFVVTRSDLATDDANEAMLAEDRDKLRQFHALLVNADDERSAELAPRLARFVDAPFLLTSSYLAEQAQRRREAGRVEQADRLWERSGIARVHAMLARSIDRREDLRLANVLAVTERALAEIERNLRAQQATLAGEPGAEEDLRAKQAQLEEVGSRQARWRTTLANGITRMQTEAGRRVTRELNLIRNHYKQILDSSPDAEAIADLLGDDLERSLHAAWQNLSVSAQTDFATLVDTVVAGLGIDDTDDLLGDLRVPEGLADVLATANSSPTFSFLDDGLPVAMQTYAFANIANAAAGALGLATGGLGLLAYGIGAAISYPINAVRRRQRERARAASEFQRLLNDALFGNEGIAKEFTTELGLRILDAREQIESLIDQRLLARRRDLETQAKELAALARAETGRRHELRRQIDERLGSLAEVRQRGRELAATVRGNLGSANLGRGNSGRGNSGSGNTGEVGNSR